MEPQTTHLKPPTTSSPLRSSSSGSKFPRFSKRRTTLLLLAIIVIVLMVVGIVFVAHRYYVQFGGQGWLKKRTTEPDIAEPILPHPYLPMRQVAGFPEVTIPWGLTDRAPGNVPFYTCGDQQESCEEFSQPVSHRNPFCVS
jgi:hypothetical protein